jgi:HK97 family phage major capsid protein
MREQRCKLVADARSIMDSNSTLDAEQRSQVDTMLNDADVLKSDIDRLEAIQNEERHLKASAGKQSEMVVSKPEIREEPKGISSAEYHDAFMKYLRGGKHALYGSEVRALQEGTNSEGGYLAPLVAADQASLQDLIVETMDDAMGFTAQATVVNVSGDITVPTESSLGAAAWTAEEAAYNDSDAAFGQITLTPYKATTIIKVSEELLADSVVNLEGYLAQNFGRRFSQLLEAAFVNGDGSSKPTGVTDGATSALTAASATAVTLDEMIQLFYSLKESYRSNGSWLFNTTTLKEIRQLKDGDNQYLWQPAVQAGTPDLLLGRPVVISDDCEDTATGKKPVLFGDLSYYWIAWRQGFQLQRLDELYAANGQIGLKASMRVDGELTQSEAVKCITMA